MAVFTPVNKSDLTSWLRGRGFGGAQTLDAIGEGIENTNYRAVCEKDGGAREYVFTIFELWDLRQVRYYADLMRHFADNGVPAPAPALPADEWQTADGIRKPCLLVPFVSDAQWRATPDRGECEKMGAMIAKLHLAAAGFGGDMPNPRGAPWRRRALEKLRPHLPAEQSSLAEEELKRDGNFAAAPLPSAACHCDLFRNNILWNGNDIAAVIDFYFGGGDSLIFDIAVAACDWCYDSAAGKFDSAKLDAMFAGYLSTRRLCALESEMLPDAFCVAALRFWLSRLYDMQFPRRARVLEAHDPRYFQNILVAARAMRKQIAKSARGAA